MTRWNSRGGFVEQPFPKIEIAEVVVRLDVHLVALQYGLVVHERLFEVAGALVVERTLEGIGTDVRGPTPDVRRPRPGGRRHNGYRLAPSA